MFPRKILYLQGLKTLQIRQIPTLTLNRFNFYSFNSLLLTSKSIKYWQTLKLLILFLKNITIFA